MRLKPTKIVFITAGIFALFHLLILLLVTTYKGSGHPGMLLLYTDYPLVWVADHVGAHDRKFELILLVGGTAFYAAVGALIGYVIQLIREA